MADKAFAPIAHSVLPTEGTEKLLRLDREELDFYTRITGIDNVDALKEHLVTVQRAACKVYPYPCIVNFYFTNLRLARLPWYPQLLELGRSREKPIYLDIGCCLGSDLRKAVFDGYPQDSVIATDIVPGFWNLGHDLFKTRPETFPVPFISGDALDPAFLDPVPPFYTTSARKISPAPALADVKSLNDLRGHVSAISICAVFHVFETEETQERLARAIAGLLSPEPGSMILGLQVGLPEKGLLRGYAFDMFCHSPESWKELWDGQIFEKGTVAVDARLVEQTRLILKGGEVVGHNRRILQWAVTRLR